MRGSDRKPTFILNRILGSFAKIKCFSLSENPTLVINGRFVLATHLNYRTDFNNFI